MRTARNLALNDRNQTIASAALLGVLSASYLWVGTALVRLLFELPLIFGVGGPLRF
jgi:hypothetical protein